MDRQAAVTVCEAYLNAALSRVLDRPGITTSVIFLDGGATILARACGEELVLAIPPGMSVSETLELVVAPLAAMITGSGPSGAEAQEPA